MTIDYQPLPALRLSVVIATTKPWPEVRRWPPVLFWRTLAPITAKRRLLLQALASSPLLALLVCCHSAGEFVGYIAGAGKSPRQPA